MCSCTAVWCEATTWLSPGWAATPCVPRPTVAATPPSRPGAESWLARKAAGRAAEGVACFWWRLRWMDAGSHISIFDDDDNDGDALVLSRSPFHPRPTIAQLPCRTPRSSLTAGVPAVLSPPSPPGPSPPSAAAPHGHASHAPAQRPGEGRSATSEHSSRGTQQNSRGAQQHGSSAQQQGSTAQQQGS